MGTQASEKKKLLQLGRCHREKWGSYGKIKPSDSTSMKRRHLREKQISGSNTWIEPSKHADLTEDGDTKQGESENQDRQGCQHLALTVKKWDVNSIANLRYPAKK